MREPLHPVFDDYGRQIGTVQRVWLGRGGGQEFWDARSLDGCDLGAHKQRDDAHFAIQDDWEAGRPRDPRSPKQRFRPIHAINSGVEPIYLGGAARPTSASDR
jgi:hypothetical protein